MYIDFNKKRSLKLIVLYRSVLALQASNQDPSLLDQISKNVTRQGITPATLNYLRVNEIVTQLVSLIIYESWHSILIFKLLDFDECFFFSCS